MVGLSRDLQVPVLDHLLDHHLPTMSSHTRSIPLHHNHLSSHYPMILVMENFLYEVMNHLFSRFCPVEAMEQGVYMMMASRTTPHMDLDLIPQQQRINHLNSPSNHFQTG